MALHQSTLAQRVASYPDLLRVLLVVAAVLVVMAVATVIFGVQGTGPGYDIVPDPAAGLGLPF